MAERTEPVTVIILSRNRPLYLWVCLDSLYRYTRHPASFVLVDNQSGDPEVRRVVAGFERRGMLDEVQWHKTNSPKRVAEAIAQYRTSPGKYLVVIESDVVVYPTSPCWLARMCELMDANPNIGILGSYIDGRDFIDPAKARQLAPDLDQYTLDGLIKAHSPERALPDDPPREAIIEPFNPPGRFAMIRKDIIDAIPFATDGGVYQSAKSANIGAFIATQVRHRHLSLLNFYDYPDYDVRARDEFHRGNDVGVQISAVTPWPIVAGKPVKK
jgi:GT2 family glycosyltransferase